MSKILDALLRKTQRRTIRQAEQKHLEDVAYFIKVPLSQWRLKEWQKAARMLARGVDSLEQLYAEDLAVAKLTEVKLERKNIQHKTHLAMKGTESTKKRPDIFRTELFNYVVVLLKAEPAILRNPDPHILIADRVRTAKASKCSIENKTWNMTGSRQNSPFLSVRTVRKEVRGILPEAKKAAGVK